MKRQTIRADRVRVGDRLADPGTGEPGPTVTAVEPEPERHTLALSGALERAGVSVIEVWVDADPMGMPTLPLDRSENVEVWR